MDVSLDGLIEKIKKDGVLEAKEKSEEIILKAKDEAKSIVLKAKDEANQIISKAQKEARDIKNNTNSTLQQAVRDSLLLVKKQIIKMFDDTLKREVSKDLNPEFTANLIADIVNRWRPSDNKLEVLSNKDDAKKLEELVFKQIKEELHRGVVIKPVESINRGFRIGIKGEDVYYDLSDEAITEMLEEFLNPEVKNIIDRKQ